MSEFTQPTLSTLFPTLPSAAYHALSPFSTSFLLLAMLVCSSVMTCFGGAPFSSRSRAMARLASISAASGPDEDVALDAASASSASRAAATSAEDMVWYLWWWSCGGDKPRTGDRRQTGGADVFVFATATTVVWWVAMSRKTERIFILSVCRRAESAQAGSIGVWDVAGSAERACRPDPAIERLFLLNRIIRCNRCNRCNMLGGLLLCML